MTDDQKLVELRETVAALVEDNALLTEIVLKMVEATSEDAAGTLLMKLSKGNAGADRFAQGVRAKVDAQSAALDHIRETVGDEFDFGPRLDGSWEMQDPRSHPAALTNGGGVWCEMCGYKVGAHL